MARDRRSIDERFMGPEPMWDEGNPCPPLDDRDRNVEWSKGSHWYNYFFKSKDHIPIVLKYAKEELGYKPKDIKALKKLPPWKLGGQVGSYCRLFYRGWIYPNEWIERTNAEFSKFLKEGSKLKAVDDEKKKDKTPVISPHERMRRKVFKTIAVDWEEMVVDLWMDGEFDKKKVKFPAYSLLQLHGLKGSAINIFRDVVLLEYNAIKAAYDKTDDYCVEAYSHIAKGDKRKMIDLMDGIFEDLDRFKEAQKAKRTTTRAKKVYSSTDQVKNLKYCKENADSKLHSINPSLLPKAKVLWMYNIKTRKLTEFKSDSLGGFEVKGSTLKKWDDGQTATLRKPEEILPQILKKTEKQINNVWKSLTTKISKPTGRINKDTILLRAE